MVSIRSILYTDEIFISVDMVPLLIISKKILLLPFCLVLYAMENITYLQDKNQDFFFWTKIKFFFLSGGKSRFFSSKKHNNLSIKIFRGIRTKVLCNKTTIVVESDYELQTIIVIFQAPGSRLRSWEYLTYEVYLIPYIKKDIRFHDCIQVSQKTSNTLELEWDPPAEPKGIIQKYKVHLYIKLSLLSDWYSTSYSIRKNINTYILWHCHNKSLKTL